MIPFAIGGALLGAWAVQWNKTRTGPRSRVVRRSMVGPVTGTAYDVEDFPDEGVLIARMPGGYATATLARVTSPEGQARLTWINASGHPAAVATMRRDLCPQPSGETASRKERP